MSIIQHHSDDDEDYAARMGPHHPNRLTPHNYYYPYRNHLNEIEGHIEGGIYVDPWGARWKLGKPDGGHYTEEEMLALSIVEDKSAMDRW